MIKAYITNLGKYVGGELCGEYLRLPAEKTDVQELLARIGVDGVVYEETFITDYETDIEGLCKYMGEYESIDELNYLAGLLSDLDKHDQEKFVAAIEYGEYTDSVKKLINLTHNLDNYDFIPDVEDRDDLGRYFVDEMGMLEVPENLQHYFDYEAYGRDVDLDINGVFSRDLGGYIYENNDRYTEHYNGRDDIPDVCKIFAYPDPPDKMPIKQQLEMFGKMITEPMKEKLTPALDERC